MLYLVRTALLRDVGGISNVNLYKHSYIGTKDLIERYIDSTLDTIRALVNTSAHSLPPGIETKDILEQVVYARQAFGRSALLLSGGATFGMNHIGVLKALFDAKLLPRIISGASAGSIVCAVLCTRTDEEIPDVLTKFPYGDLAVFEEEGKEDGLLERIGRFLTQGAWIDIQHLIRVMKALLGDMTFQEAYNRTRRILNICVSSASIYELPRLLNYVTSPNVMIWSAVAASCSVPLLFSAAHLLVKNPITGEHVPWNPTPQRWIDGSVDNDLPMTRLAEMFNVNHFIVSQVNPHVVPFLAKDDPTLTQANQNHAYSGCATDWLFTATNLAKGEALHRMHVLADLGIFPNLITKARSILSQKYSGDITILPEIYYRDFPRILKNPTSDFMVQACLCGERATWPKLSRIRNHCAVELELDSAVQQLRARVVFSPSQVDLRRLSAGNMLMSHGSTGARRRRVSGSNAFTSSTRGVAEDDTEEGSGKIANISAAKPPLRTASSHFGSSLIRGSLPPFSAPPYLSSSSASASPLDPNTPPLPGLPVSQIPTYATTKRPKTSPELRDLTSEAETTEGMGGFASSDADIDSHTDESSSETEEISGGYINQPASRTLSFSPSQASLFLTITSGSCPQPTTPGIGINSHHSSLKLNATTPPSSIVTPPLLSPELTMTQLQSHSHGHGKGGSIIRGGVTAPQPKDRGRETVPRPSSPERMYKKIFQAAIEGAKKTL
jgi:TAG lipase / steryl ester hydrolase / phospholipase A2 / LPA acyltransferase